MAEEEETNARQAASVYELCMKLGHQLDDVRDRAVRALMTKTNTGLISPITVARVVEFPQLALHWLNDRHKKANMDLVKAFIRFYTGVVATCVAENTHIRERFISSGAIEFFEDFRGFEARYAEEIDAALSCLLSQTGPSSSGPIVQRPPKDPPLPPGHAAEQAKAARAQPSWLQLVSVSSADERRLFEASCRIKYSSVGRSKRIAALQEVRYVMVYDYPVEVFFSHQGLLVVEALLTALSDEIDREGVGEEEQDDLISRLIAESLNAVLFGLMKKLEHNEKLPLSPCVGSIHAVLLALVNTITRCSSTEPLTSLNETAKTALQVLTRGLEKDGKRYLTDLGLPREEVLKYLDLVADALARYFCPSEYYEASSSLRLVRCWSPPRLAVFDLCSELLVLSRDVLMQRKMNDRLTEHLISWSMDTQLYHHRAEAVEKLAALVLQGLSVRAYQDFRALQSSSELDVSSDRVKAAGLLKGMGVEPDEYHWGGDCYAAVELRYAMMDVPEAHRLAYERKLDVLLASRPPMEITGASSRTAELVYGQYGMTLRHAFVVGGHKLRGKVVEAMQSIIIAIDTRRQLALLPEGFVLNMLTIACSGVELSSFRPSLWSPFVLLLLQSDGLRELTLHSVRLLCAMVVHLGPNVLSRDILELGVVPYIIRPMVNSGTAYHFMLAGSLWLLGTAKAHARELRDVLVPLTHTGNVIVVRQLTWRVLGDYYSDELEERILGCALDEDSAVAVRMECLRIIAMNMTPVIAAEIAKKLPCIVKERGRVVDGAMREAAVEVMGAIEDGESLKILAAELTKMNLWSAVIDSGSPSSVWSLVSRCMENDAELLAYLSMHTTLFGTSHGMPLCGPMLQVLRTLRAQLGTRRGAEALRPAMLWMGCQGECMAQWVREWVSPCLATSEVSLRLPWKATLALASISCIGDCINQFQSLRREIQTMQGEIVPVVAELDFSAPVRELLECFRPEHISSAACDVAIAIKSILTPSASTDSAVANTILGRISKALSEVITGLQSAGTPRERSSETYRFVATLTQLLGRIATMHPILSLEGEAPPFVRAFKMVWLASTSERKPPTELSSEELTAVLLDLLVTLIDVNRTLTAIPDLLARSGLLSLVLSLATRADVPTALLARCCDVISLAKRSLMNRSILGKVMSAIIDAHVKSALILRSTGGEAVTTAVTRATVVFDLVTDVAACQQTAARVGPRLVEEGWIEMLQPIPNARHAITPTLQNSIGRMVLALCLSPCPVPRRTITASESCVETLWRRAVEKEDALAFIAMAVLSCHTSKMSGMMTSLVETKREDGSDSHAAALHGNLMHAICLQFREDSEFRPYRV